MEGRDRQQRRRHYGVEKPMGQARQQGQVTLPPFASAGSLSARVLAALRNPTRICSHGWEAAEKKVESSGPIKRLMCVRGENWGLIARFSEILQALASRLGETDGQSRHRSKGLA